MDDPVADGSVLDRLRLREAERAAEAARRQESVASEGVGPRESVQAFLAEFASSRRALEALLVGATDHAAAGEAGSEALGRVQSGIADLEQTVASAAYFLPPYDLRQATVAVASLKEQLDTAQAALQPRKKFSFRSRAAPAAAAAAGPGAAAAAPGAAAATAPSSTEAPSALPAAAAAAAAAFSQIPAGSASTSGRTISGLRGVEWAEPRAAMAGGSGAPEDYTLSDLEDCTILLPGPLAALFMHRLRRCTIVTGPVGGATFAEDVEGCTLMVASRQVRIHAAHGTDLYVRVLSNPIIEHSDGLRFAPYQPVYPGAAEDLEAAGQAAENGLWRDVHDFSWLRSAASPHWAVLPEAARRAPPG